MPLTLSFAITLRDEYRRYYAILVTPIRLACDGHVTPAPDVIFAIAFDSLPSAARHAAAAMIFHC